MRDSRFLHNFDTAARAVADPVGHGSNGMDAGSVPDHRTPVLPPDVPAIDHADAQTGALADARRLVAYLQMERRILENHLGHQARFMDSQLRNLGLAILGGFGCGTLFGLLF
jgi:hypothetical protein